MLIANLVIKRDFFIDERQDRKEAAPRTCEFRGSAGAESVGDDDGN